MFAGTPVGASGHDSPRGGGGAVGPGPGPHGQADHDTTVEPHQARGHDQHCRQQGKDKLG
jgi:hypothetical protein